MSFEDTGIEVIISILLRLEEKQNAHLWCVFLTQGNALAIDTITITFVITPMTSTLE